LLSDIHNLPSIKDSYFWDITITFQKIFVYLQCEIIEKWQNEEK
jgi:hypothetical protein